MKGKEKPRQRSPAPDAFRLLGPEGQAFVKEAKFAPVPQK